MRKRIINLVRIISKPIILKSFTLAFTSNVLINQFERIEFQQINDPHQDENVQQFLKEMHDQFLDEYVDDGHSLKFVSPVNEEHDGELATHAQDAHSYHKTFTPICILYAQTTEDVIRFTEICTKYKIEIVSYNKGTSLEGASLPTSDKCAMINFQYMNKIIEFLPEDRQIIVQPGIGWMDLNQFLEPYELFFPVDPGPGAGIGGMVGTCCSGTNAMKYGTMRNWVKALEVVLANGSIIKTGNRAKKSSAGYNLTQLFCGSEGTLGLFTQITLQLTQLPKHSQVITVCFENLDQLSKAVEEILKHQLDIRCVELMDKNMVNVIMDRKQQYPQLIQNNNLLMLAMNADEQYVNEQIKRIRQIVQKQNGHNLQYAADKMEADKLWSVRKQALWIVQQYGIDKINKNVKVWTTDVCVPISQLALNISQTQQEIEENKLIGPIIGHVGDGNYHVTFIVDYQNQKQWKLIQQINHNMIMRAINCGGTCTGEHGVGIGKRMYLKIERGQEQLQLMRLIKKAFDPLGLLNPGKVFYMNSDSEHDHLDQH